MASAQVRMTEIATRAWLENTVAAAAFVALVFMEFFAVSPEKGPAASHRDGSLSPLAPGALEVSMLFDDLRVGDRVGEWEVSAVSAPVEGIARVELLRKAAYFSVGIGSRGTAKAPPYRVSESYELGWGEVRPDVGSVSEEDARPVVEELMARLKRHEDRVPKPAGL